MENDFLDRYVEFTKLKSKDVVCYKGKESIFPDRDSYKFYDWNFEYFYARMQLLMQSGIYHIWNKYYQIHNPTPLDSILEMLRKEQSDLNEVIPISLKSTIVTVFCIYLAGSCLAGISVTIECRAWIYKKLTLAFKIISKYTILSFKVSYSIIQYLLSKCSSVC